MTQIKNGDTERPSQGTRREREKSTVQGDEGRWYDQANFYGISDCIGTPITRPIVSPWRSLSLERDASCHRSCCNTSCLTIHLHPFSVFYSETWFQTLYPLLAFCCARPFLQLLPGCSCTYSCMFENTKAYSSDNIDRSLICLRIGYRSVTARLSIHLWLSNTGQQPLYLSCAGL